MVSDWMRSIVRLGDMFMSYDVFHFFFYFFIIRLNHRFGDFLKDLGEELIVQMIHF
ncbi:MAG: hypothetical protein ACW96X_08720 [Promethearchaeota archaeon]|jgi:hypothetical protein